MSNARCTECKYSITNTRKGLCPFYLRNGNVTCKDNKNFTPVNTVEVVPITQSRFYTPPCEEGMKVVQPNILTTEE